MEKKTYDEKTIYQRRSAILCSGDFFLRLIALVMVWLPTSILLYVHRHIGNEIKVWILQGGELTGGGGALLGYARVISIVKIRVYSRRKQKHICSSNYTFLFEFITKTCLLTAAALIPVITFTWIFFHHICFQSYHEVVVLISKGPYVSYKILTSAFALWSFFIKYF